MRLWHKDLIHYLPNMQLLGQHRECCALRGKGWGKKHSVVDYVFKHPYMNLYYYHKKVINEMLERGYSVDTNWCNQCYRGKKLGTSKNSFTLCAEYEDGRIYLDYHEHNDKYLEECIDNLRSKNAELVNGKSLSQFKLELAVKGVS